MEGISESHCSSEENETLKLQQENQLLRKKLHEIALRYRNLQQNHDSLTRQSSNVQLQSVEEEKREETSNLSLDFEEKLSEQDTFIRKLEDEKHDLIEKLKKVVGTCRVMQKQLIEVREENVRLGSPNKSEVTERHSGFVKTEEEKNLKDSSAEEKRIALTNAKVLELEETLQKAANAQERLCQSHELEIAALQRDLSEQEMSFSSKKQDLEIVIERLTVQLGEQMQRFQDMEQIEKEAVASVGLKQSVCDQELLAKTELVMEMERRLKMQNSEVEAVKSALAQSKWTVEELRSELVKEKGIRKELERCNSCVEMQLLELEGRSSERQYQIDQLQTQIRMTDEEKQSAERERDELAQKVEVMTSQIEDLHKQSLGLNNAAQSQIDELQTQIATLNVTSKPTTSTCVSYATQEAQLFRIADLESLLLKQHGFDERPSSSSLSHTPHDVHSFTDNIEKAKLSPSLAMDHVSAENRYNTPELLGNASIQAIVLEDHEKTLKAMEEYCEKTVAHVEGLLLIQEKKNRALSEKLHQAQHQATIYLSEIADIQAQLQSLPGIESGPEVEDIQHAHKSNCDAILELVRTNLLRAEDYEKKMSELALSTERMRAELDSQAQIQAKDNARDEQQIIDLKQMLNEATETAQREKENLLRDLKFVETELNGAKDENVRMLFAIARASESAIIEKTESELALQKCKARYSERFTMQQRNNEMDQEYGLVLLTQEREQNEKLQKAVSQLQNGKKLVIFAFKKKFDDVVEECKRLQAFTLNLKSKHDEQILCLSTQIYADTEAYKAKLHAEQEKWRLHYEKTLAHLDQQAKERDTNSSETLQELRSHNDDLLHALENCRKSQDEQISEREIAFGDLQNEVTALKLQLEAEMEAGTAARDALDAYKKRARVALKKATGDLKLLLRQATEEADKLREQCSTDSIVMSAMKEDVASAQAQIANMEAEHAHTLQALLTSHKNAQEDLQNDCRTQMTVLQELVQKDQCERVDLIDKLERLYRQKELMAEELDSVRMICASKYQEAVQALRDKDAAIGNLQYLLQDLGNERKGVIDPDNDEGIVWPTQRQRQEREASMQSPQSLTQLDTQSDTCKEEIAHVQEIYLGRKQSALKMDYHNTMGLNIEYLRNIVLKYLSSQNQSEKERLVPVLAAILQLSPSDMQKINAQSKRVPDNSGVLGNVWSMFGSTNAASFKPLAVTPSAAGVRDVESGISKENVNEVEDMTNLLNPFAISTRVSTRSHNR